MHIVLLTPDRDKENEINIVNKLFEIGLQSLHLRKEEYSINEYRNYLNAINSQYHSRIILHGSGFELFNDFELSGVHLKSYQKNDDTTLKKISHIPRSLVSASFHSWQEILNDKSEYRYVFISPVFDSISKVGYNASIDLAGLGNLKKSFIEQKRKCPEIIGLGGIDVPHIATLNQFHFDGCVLYSAIWKSSNPIMVFNGIMRLPL